MPARNASGRVLGRGLASAGAVLACARALSACDAAAVVTGAVQAVDDLDEDQVRTVLDTALAWGHKTPRKAALEKLLADGNDELVHSLACDDPDASIRLWASRQLSEKDTPPSLFD